MKNLILTVILVLIYFPLSDARQTEGTGATVDSLFREYHFKMKHNNIPDALNDIYHVIEMAEGSKGTVSEEKLAQAYLLAGNIHFTYSDYEGCINYYKKGLKLTHSRETRLKFAIRLSISNCMYGNADETLRYSEMIKSLEPKDSKLKDYHSIISRAFYLKRFDDLAKAIPLFRRALHIADSAGMVGYCNTPLSELAEYYDETDTPDSMLKYLNQYEVTSANVRNPIIIADCQRRYMRYYIKRGDRERALYYSNRYMETMDSAVKIDRFITTTSRVNSKREAVAAEQIADLKFTLSLHQIALIALTALVILAICGVFVMRRIKGDKRALFDRNKELAMIEEAENHPKSTESTNPETEQKTTASHENKEWDSLMSVVKDICSDPKNYCNPDFSINTLASLSGSNTKYLSQAINDTTGENFRTYLNRFRINEARRRLAVDPEYKGLTIQSIGESVGFRSVANFNIAFKKLTGMTPSAFQKMSKGSL